MAKIGEKIKEIEVHPLREPDPTFVPNEPAAPERVPELEPEPVEACSLVQS